MKSIIFLSFFVAAISAQRGGLFRCRNGVQARKEWRTLSNPEKTKFMSAMHKVMQRSDEKSPSFYDKLAKDHLDFVSSIHGHAAFFPWHRYMLAKLEQELQKHEEVTLPYWDWGYDSQSPEKAAIWGSGPLTFGGNGDSKTECVTDGAFANHQGLYPEPHCLKRQWKTRTTISALTPGISLQRTLTTQKSYDSYREGIEGPHGSVHVAIGGDMMSPSTSPNDPVFYLHHANVDRLWWKWQSAYPQLANSFSGSSFTDGGGLGESGVSDKLSPYNARVSDVFKTEALCYTYKEENLDTFKPELPPTTVKEGGRRQKRGADSPVKVEPAPEKTKISSTDRSDLLHIRTPDPLPESWLKANGMNVEMVRAREKRSAALIDELNKKEGPIEGALWTRPGVLAKLIGDGATNFHADVGGIRVEVKAPEEKPLQAVADLKEHVKLALKKEGKDVNLSEKK